MTYEVGKVWNPQAHPLAAELDLLKFSLELKSAFSSSLSKVQIIQIGDSYDLWVGCGFASEKKKKKYESDLFMWINYYGTKLYPLMKYATPAGLISAGIEKYVLRLLDPSKKPIPYAYLLDPLTVDNEQEKMVLVDSSSPRYKVVSYYGQPVMHSPDTKVEDFELIKDPITEIVAIVKDIQGTGNTEWVKYVDGVEERMKKIVGTHFKSICVAGNRLLNPAEAALRLLQETFRANEMIFIYGNHDNYLIDSRVYLNAGIQKRDATFEDKETKTIYVEHAHRMEAAFANEFKYRPIFLGGIPRNNDSVSSGFLATNVAYIDRNADKGWQIPQMWDGRFTKRLLDYGSNHANETAGDHDQPNYINQFAKLSLGRKATGKGVPPHIMIIGHTHMPVLKYVDSAIDYEPSKIARLTAQGMSIGFGMY